MVSKETVRWVLQAEIPAELIGAAVHAFNQRDIAGILAMIRTVGALGGTACPELRSSP
jgi:hypothetical protein